MSDDTTQAVTVTTPDRRQLQAQLTEDGRLALQHLDGGAGEVVEADSERAQQLAAAHPEIAQLVGQDAPAAETGEE